MACVTFLEEANRKRKKCCDIEHQNDHELVPEYQEWMIWQQNIWALSLFDIFHFVSIGIIHVLARSIFNDLISDTGHHSDNISAT